MSENKPWNSVKGLLALFNKPAFKYLLAIGLLAWVLWKNWQSTPEQPGLATVWQRHVLERQPIHGGYLALAAVIALGSILLTFVRWYVLVRAVDLPFTLGNAMRLGLVGFFFNIFIPGSVGGDVIKATFIAKQQSRRTVSVATVIIDRALALWALMWFVAILGSAFWTAGFLQGEVEETSHSIVLSAAALVGVSLLVWVLLGFLPPHRAERFAGRLGRLPKVGHSAAEFWRAVWMYRCRQRSVLVAMVMALIGHIGFVLAFYFSALTLADPAQKIPTWSEHFLIVPIGMVIQAVPVFPGGVGIGELGFGGLYRMLECSAAAGILGSLVQRVIFWVIGIGGYVVYLSMRPAIRAATEEKTVELLAAET